MSYLGNLQRHAAMEYGEVPSVMALKPGWATTPQKGSQTTSPVEMQTTGSLLRERRWIGKQSSSFTH